MYKTISAYSITENIDIEHIKQSLEANLAREILDTESIARGWLPVMGEMACDFSKGYAIRLQTLEKIIPSASLARMVNKRVTEIEEAENRKVPKKEVSLIKDSIIHEILPTALVKETITHAYIDLENMMIVVNASAKKAEDMLSFLRKCTGSLPVKPVFADQVKIMLSMGSWALSQNLPPKVYVSQTIDLIHPDEGKIKIRHAPVDNEITSMINAGCVVEMLGMNIDGQASFNLSKTGELKNFMMDDELLTKEPEETDEDQFTADSILQAGTVAIVINTLKSAFGD